MSGEPETRLAWWRKRRWLAAIALWLSVPWLYALSVGPAEYAIVRGWVSVDSTARPYSPLYSACESWPQLNAAVLRWQQWWAMLAWRHRDREPDTVGREASD